MARIFVTNQKALFNKFSGYEFLTLEQALDRIKDYEWVGVDSETDGLNCHLDNMMLLQLGDSVNQVVIDIPSFTTFPTILKEFIESKKLILQNAKFDLKFLFSKGVVPVKVYDTMLVEQILTNGEVGARAGLAAIAQKYCNLNLDKSIREDMVKQFSLTQAVVDYSAADVIPLHGIMEAQMKEVKALNMTGVVNIENNFVVVLAYIEWCGIRMDPKKWAQRVESEKAKQVVAYQELLDYLQEKYPEYFSKQLDLFSETTECLLNFNSPSQVKELFKKDGINTVFKERGKMIEAIDKKHLADQVQGSALLQRYFAYKKATHQLNAFGENWFKYINPKTERIHTTFKQLADTGRLKCGNVRENAPRILGLSIEI